jgi:hypothetical protein
MGDLNILITMSEHFKFFKTVSEFLKTETIPSPVVISHFSFVLSLWNIWEDNIVQRPELQSAYRGLSI